MADRYLSASHLTDPPAVDLSQDDSSSPGQVGSAEVSALRMRCIEAAARPMKDQGFDAGNREQLTLDAADRFYLWVTA